MIGPLALGSDFSCVQVLTLQKLLNCPFMETKRVPRPPKIWYYKYYSCLVLHKDAGRRWRCSATKGSCCRSMIKHNRWVKQIRREKVKVQSIISDQCCDQSPCVKCTPTFETKMRNKDVPGGACASTKSHGCVLLPWVGPKQEELQDFFSRPLPAHLWICWPGPGLSLWDDKVQSVYSTL